MNLIISTLDNLNEEATQIQSDLDVTQSEDANEAQERGNMLAAYISRTGKMLADAKYHLNAKKKSDIMETLVDVAKRTPNASSTVVNELIKSLCKEEQYLVDWIERLNKTSTHQLEWCRTVISKAKAEMAIGSFNKS